MGNKPPREVYNGSSTHKEDDQKMTTCRMAKKKRRGAETVGQAKPKFIMGTHSKNKKKRHVDVEWIKKYRANCWVSKPESVMCRLHTRTNKKKKK